MNEKITAHPQKEEREKVLKAVSYTHLDVYKRQVLVDVKNGNGNRRILSATNELTAPLAYEINEIVVAYESRLSTVRQTEETNRQLMTSLSHDVRTPLTTLLGYLDAAHKGLVTGKDRDDYIETARRKAHDLKEYIDVLFDWFKLNSNEFALEIQSVEAAELTRNILIDWIPIFEDKQAVSYTHLDVYKRQPHALGFVLLCVQLQEPRKSIFTVRRHHRFRICSLVCPGLCIKRRAVIAVHSTVTAEPPFRPAELVERRTGVALDIQRDKAQADVPPVFAFPPALVGKSGKVVVQVGSVVGKDHTEVPVSYTHLFLSAHQQNAGSNPIHKRRVMLHKQKRRRSFQQQLLDLHAGKDVNIVQRFIPKIEMRLLA